MSMSRCLLTFYPFQTQDPDHGGDSGGQTFTAGAPNVSNPRFATETTMKDSRGPTSSSTTRGSQAPSTAMGAPPFRDIAAKRGREMMEAFNPAQKVSPSFHLILRGLEGHRELPKNSQTSRDDLRRKRAKIPLVHQRRRRHRRSPSQWIRNLLWHLLKTPQLCIRVQCTGAPMLISKVVSITPAAFIY